MPPLPRKYKKRRSPSPSSTAEIEEGSVLLAAQIASSGGTKKKTSGGKAGRKKLSQPEMWSLISLYSQLKPTGSAQWNNLAKLHSGVGESEGSWPARDGSTLSKKLQKLLDSTLPSGWGTGFDTSGLKPAQIQQFKLVEAAKRAQMGLFQAKDAPTLGDEVEEEDEADEEESDDESGAQAVEPAVEEFQMLATLPDSTSELNDSKTSELNDSAVSQSSAEIQSVSQSILNLPKSSQTIPIRPTVLAKSKAAITAGTPPEFRTPVLTPINQKRQKVDQVGDSLMKVLHNPVNVGNNNEWFQQYILMEKEREAKERERERAREVEREIREENRRREQAEREERLDRQRREEREQSERQRREDSERFMQFMAAIVKPYHFNQPPQ